MYDRALVTIEKLIETRIWHKIAQMPMTLSEFKGHFWNLCKL